MKRCFDLLLAVFSGLVLLPVLVFICLAVRVTSHGPVLYWSERVGRSGKIFKMPKFRSMQFDTPVVATHLLNNPSKYLTPIGGFLRRSSLDELPQLWNIIKGDMSFVGPRPALFNQYDLILLRRANGVHMVVPGLTGWAQINGRDSLPVREKVLLDAEYVRRRSMWFDFLILAKTLIKVFLRNDVSH